MTAGVPPLSVTRTPLSRLTTLGVGGEAEVWTVHDHGQLAQAMRAPYRVLGGGSNLVVADAGVPGRVLRLSGMFRDEALDAARGHDPATHVTGWIGAGVPLPGLLRRLAQRGLSGLEGTAGIPAQVGGAVWMNAGTRFGEMFGALHRLEVASPAGVRVLRPEDLDWAYRRSGLSRADVVTRVQLRLTPSTPDEVARRTALADQARKGQPKNRTPGCAFKNPGGVSAGKLIDDTGLKGLRVGQAMIAPEHGNFIVNLGGASSRDVHALLDHIRLAVEAPLELEYELWG